MLGERTICLGEAGTWLSGGTPSTKVPEYWDGDIPWITASSLHDFRLHTSQRKLTPLGAANGTRMVPPGTVLFVVRGMSLKREFRVGVSTRELAFGQDCKAIVPSADILPEFLAYALQAKRHEILALVDEASHGTGRLETTALQQLEIRVPDPEQQRAIVNILGAIDDKLALARETIATLEALAQREFRARFVEPSNNGLLPGWTVRPLDAIAEFRNGLALQNFRPRDDEPRLPVVKIAQLRAGRTIGEEWARADIDPACIIDDADLVFSWSGTLLVRVWCGGRAALNQHLFRVSSDAFPKSFVLGWLLHHLPEFQRIADAKATTMGHIQRRHLTDALCVVPPPDQLAPLCELLDSCLRRQVALALETRTLEQLRAALLTPLLSGARSLPDPSLFVR